MERHSSPDIYNMETNMITTVNELCIQGNIDENNIHSRYSLNPFYLPTYGSDLIYMNYDILTNRFPELYILCLSENFELTEDSGNMINLFYRKDSNIQDLIKASNIVTLIISPISLIKYPIILSGLLTIKKDILEYFNHENYKLMEENLVYLMLETKKETVKRWIRLYEPKNLFDRYLQQKIFTGFYGINCSRVDENLILMIENIPDFKYWHYEENCNIDLNYMFKKRRFNFIKSKNKYSNENKENRIHELLESFRNDELKILGYHEQIMDIFDCSMQNKTTRSTYIPTNPDNLRIKAESINELLLNGNLDEKEKYFLICNILLSKDYCHYILGNRDLLEKNKSFFTEYLPVIRYVMSYSWVSLYLDEYYKSNKIKKSDRFVFDINTAAALPLFPFDIDFPYTNPYFCSPIAKKLLNVKKNIISVRHQYYYQNGIVNLEEFRRRLNIFMTGDPNYNILDGVNWENMVITGSVMAAIIPKTNALIERFKSTKNLSIFPTDEELVDFFQEYYSESDLDIACNHNNIYDFVTHVIHVASIIRKKLGTLKGNEINITPHKTLVIYVDAKVLKRKCKSKEVPYEYTYIMMNKDKHPIKLYFYELYLEQKKIANNIHRKRLGDKLLENNEYVEIIKYCELEKTILIISDTKQMDSKDPSSNYDNISDTIYYAKDNDIIFAKFIENFKFKIDSTSPLMKHQIELFRIRDKEFISCISRFHLPCVRSYYDGINCYMLPSAITAYLTFFNIDFKYFFGKHDPVNIIDKYRMRGYSTLLNKDEIKDYVSFFLQKSEIYNNDTAPNSEKKIIGVLSIKHKLFNPRKREFPIINVGINKNISVYNFYKNRYLYYPSIMIRNIIRKNGRIKIPNKYLIGISYDILSKK